MDLSKFGTATCFHASIELILSVCLCPGALFFVKPIRSRNYVTLMDPFQNKYGNTVAAVIFIPALIADVMWAACILGILGEWRRVFSTNYIYV